MTLLAGSTAEAMIQATGGVVVTNGGDSTYGHFERIPLVEADDAGGYVGGILTTQPSVVVAEGMLPTNFPTARQGIGQTVVVDGESWQVYDIVPVDIDGGTVRFMLKVVD